MKFEGGMSRLHAVPALLLLLPFVGVSQYATQDYHKMTVHETDNTNAFYKEQLVVRPGVDAKPKCTGEQILAFSQLPPSEFNNEKIEVKGGYSVDGFDLQSSGTGSAYRSWEFCSNVFKKNYWVCDCFRPMYVRSDAQAVEETQGITIKATYSDSLNMYANVIRRLDCVLELDFFLPFTGSTRLPSHPKYDTKVRYTPNNYTISEMFEYTCNAFHNNGGKLRDSRRCPPWYGYPATLVHNSRKSDGQATKACPKGSVANQVLRRKCHNKQISYPEGWENLGTHPNRRDDSGLPVRQANMPLWGAEDEVWEVVYQDERGYIDSPAVFPAWNVLSYSKVFPEKRGRCDQDTGWQVSFIIAGAIAGVVTIVLAILYYKIFDPAPKIQDKELEVGDDVWVKGATVPISVEQGRIQASRKLHATVTAISMNRRQITVRYDGGGTGQVDATQIEVDLTRRPNARGERGEADELDVVYYYDESICRCCPRGCTVGTVTIAMMFFAVALGAAFNIAFWEFTDEQRQDWGKALTWVGTMWLNMLTLVAVPVLCLIMVVTPSRVSNMGGKATRAVLLFLFSSAFAAFEAIIWVNLFRPGENIGYLPNPSSMDGADAAAKREYYAGVADIGPKDAQFREIDSLLGIGYAAFPKSIITAMADANILGCLIFFVTFGWILKQHKYNVMSEWRVTVLYFAKGCLKVLMVMVNWLISFAPWGMFSLVLGNLASIKDFSHVFRGVGMFLIIVTCAQIVHQVFFHFLVLFGFAHANPFKYYFRVSNAIFKAFATGSSAASMPVTLKSVKGPGEVRKEVAEFLIPLGAAVNKDGTALTLPIAVIFCAQAYGYTVPWMTQITIAALSVCISISAAPVPYASVMYLAMLMRVCGDVMLQEDVVTHAIALLLVFEWYTDRLSTATNVWSDCVITKIIDTWERRKKQGVKIGSVEDLADA